MASHTVGRNDPCPCGSGKKYKHCCLNSDQAQPNGNGNTDPQGFPFGGFAESPAAKLQSAVGDKIFDSEDDVRSFVESFFTAQNLSSADDFHGLSPEQMHKFLYSPFDSPELVTFPEVLSAPPVAPIMTIVESLIAAIDEKGLKATEKGNLPRALCREIAERYYRDWPSPSPFPHDRINRENDFPDLERARFTMLHAGLLRKTKGRFFLTRKCTGQLKKHGMAGIYPLLLQGFARMTEWSEWDGLPLLPIVQDSFLFSLYLFKEAGPEPRLHTYYAESFLSAFPVALREIPANSWVSPEKMLAMCYTARMLVHFAKFFGLIRLELVDGDYFRPVYLVHVLPQLRDAVRFHL